jgi:hypothetical protein
MYYFVTLLFVILSAKASFIDASNICWFLIDILILWVGFERKRFRKSDVKVFFNFSLIYVSFCTLRSIFLTQLPLSYWISDIVFLVKYILTSFLFCALLKEKTIYYLVKVSFQLTIISLVFYCLQLISGSLVFAMGKMINLPSAHAAGYVNFLVFTYVQQHPFQNSGFSWEPGAFGFFLNLILLLHFLTNDFTFDKKAKWFAIAIITTLSTTAYIAFLFIILLYFRARGVKFAKLLFFIVPIVCVLTVSLPFLFDKIMLIYSRDMSDMKNIETLNQYYLDRGQGMPLNRFASLLYLSQTFGIKLIWGVSNLYNNINPLIKNISISNGIFSFFAQFGAVGLSFLLYKCYVLFRKYTGSAELSIYCILVILIFGFAECIFVTSLMLCFFFLYYYAQPEVYEDEQTLTQGEIFENDGVYQISAATGTGRGGGFL